MRDRFYCRPPNPTIDIPMSVGSAPRERLPIFVLDGIPARGEEVVAWPPRRRPGIRSAVAKPNQSEGIEVRRRLLIVAAPERAGAPTPGRTARPGIGMATH